MVLVGIKRHKSKKRTQRRLPYRNGSHELNDDRWVTKASKAEVALLLKKTYMKALLLRFCQTVPKLQFYIAASFVFPKTPDQFRAKYPFADFHTTNLKKGNYEVCGQPQLITLHEDSDY